MDGNAERLSNAAGICLVIDGWKNVRRESLINVMACIPDPIFLKSVQTETARQTKEYIFSLVDEQIIKLGNYIQPSNDLIFCIIYLKVRKESLL